MPASTNVPDSLRYRSGVARAPDGGDVFSECSDGYRLRIPTTEEAVRRYNAFDPMKRAVEHFAAGNEERGKKFMKIAEEEHDVNFYDTM